VLLFRGVQPRCDRAFVVEVAGIPEITEALLILRQLEPGLRLLWRGFRELSLERLERVAFFSHGECRYRTIESAKSWGGAVSLNTVQRSKAVEMVGLLRCRRSGDVQRFSDR
jgi:hypothetical protein